MPSDTKKTASGLTRIGTALTAGCGATLCVHPLDVVRVNLQVDSAAPGGKRVYSGTFDCIRQIFARDGVRGLYSGLSAGILRQCTYGGPRMAIYPAFVDYVSDGKGAASLPLWKKFLCGASAGGLASMTGVPSEVCLVRMSADNKLPADDPNRRNYKGVLDALTRIAREEGVTTLWEGAAPTVARAVLLNAGQLAVYSQAKQMVSDNTPVKADILGGIPLQFCSSLISGLFAVGFSCPADVLKSRMQNMRPGEFSGVVDCGKKLVQAEGVGALWKGFTPAYIKLAPHTVISFIILDNLTKMITGKEAL